MARDVTCAPSAKPAPVWIALALALVTVAVYCPVTGFQFVNIDDPKFITDNPHVRAGLTVEGFKWAWGSEVAENWHPITVLSHMLDCQLCGVKPWWPHLVNAVLHALNAVLLFGLLKRMTGAMWRSAIVAALFALHPLRVESVAWVAERKDVLSTLFWFLTMWAYVRYADKWRVESGEWRVFYGVSLLFFALGLMSKPMLVTLPFTLLLLDFWPLGRMKAGASVRRLAGEKIPFFAMSAALCLVTFRVQKHSGIVVSLQHLPLSWRLDNALVSYVRYIGMMFWPRHLAWIYLMRPGQWPWWVVTLAALLLLAVFALVLAQWRLRPYLAAGWFWYLGTLVPAIGLVQVGMQALADRYTYVPMIGLFVILVWGGWEWAGAWRLGRWAPGVTVAALAACAALTVHQEFYWKDTETFCKRMIEVAPDNAWAHNNMGTLCMMANRTNEAISQYEEAIRLKPDDAEAHYSLGIALGAKGQSQEAIHQYREAIRLKPDYAEAWDNLGIALSSIGQTDQAIRQYQEAIRLKPDDAEAHNNLGAALGGKGQTDQAISQLQEAIRLEPDDAEAHNNLGAALERKGQIDEAISQYREAIRLKPDLPQVRNKLGAALAMRGQFEEAIDQYQEAIRLKPDNAEAHYNLGLALGRKGQMDAAVGQYQEAIRLKPDFADAHNNLGAALEKKGQINEAISHYREAVRLKPELLQARNNLGAALAMKGQFDEAISQYREAIRLKPDFAAAHLLLGIALKAKGQIDEAVREFQEAIRLKPDYADACNELGVALAMKGQLDQAIAQFQEAIRLKPDLEGARNNLAQALRMKQAPAGR